MSIDSEVGGVPNLEKLQFLSELITSGQCAPEVNTIIQQSGIPNQEIGYEPNSDTIESTIPNITALYLTHEIHGNNKDLLKIAQRVTGNAEPGEGIVIYDDEVCTGVVAELCDPENRLLQMQYGQSEITFKIITPEEFSEIRDDREAELQSEMRKLQEKLNALSGIKRK